MKKFLMLALSFVVLITTYAQDKQFQPVSNLFILGQVEKAKPEIDKIMNDPKAQAKAEGWLWKARIYSELFYAEDLRAKYPGSGEIAFEAFKKYENMDPTYKLVSDASVGWRPMDLIYVASFNVGRKFFDDAANLTKVIDRKADSIRKIQDSIIIISNNKKNEYLDRIKLVKEELQKKQAGLWDSSYNTFVVAAHMGEIIVKKDLRKTGAKIDTVSVLYTAYAAQNAKKEDEASKYYEKFADLKIGGNDYKDAYTYILINASNKKNEEKFYKYLNIAKEVYPGGDWDDFEFDYINKNLTLVQKLEKYDKDDAAGTLNARKYLLFGQTFSEIGREEKHDLDSLGKIKYERKAIDAFTKAYNKDNTLALAAFNAGVIYYNEFGVYEERQNNNRRALQELNTNKPVEKDPKKKPAAEAKFKEQTDAIKKANADLEKPLLETIDNAINWLEKSYVIFKVGDTKDRTIKTCLNNAVKWLANCYQYKREKVKGKDVKAYDAYDAKYKEYDALYGKF
jgi:tetratricopeptide (TPR) repeat protein